MDYTSVIAKNQIQAGLAKSFHFNDAFKWRRWDGDKWRDADIVESRTLNSAKTELIKQGLHEYTTHENDPFSYSRDEIKAVRKFRDSAALDIAFLLSMVDNK